VTAKATAKRPINGRQVDAKFMKLRSAARKIVDSQDFEERIVRAAALYIDQRSTDDVTARLKRETLRSLARQAAGLANWLERATASVRLTSQPGTDVTEHDAWLSARAAAAGHLNISLEADPSTYAALLRSISGAAALASVDIPNKKRKSAPRLAAEGICSALVACGREATAYDDGPAVRLLVAIAVAAGDRHLTPKAARPYVSEVVKKSRQAQ